MKYLFSTSEGNRYAIGPYDEYLNLKIKGIIRQPEKNCEKTMKAIFLGKREMIAQINNESFSGKKPISVGSFTLRGEYRQYLGALPFDTIPMISSLLETKQIRFIDLYGLSPRYCRASITCVSFFRDCDPEEYLALPL